MTRLYQRILRSNNFEPEFNTFNMIGNINSISTTFTQLIVFIFINTLTIILFYQMYQLINILQEDQWIELASLSCSNIAIKIITQMVFILDI